MVTRNIQFEVNGSTLAEGNFLASDLQRMLSDVAEEIQVARQKKAPNTLDLGSIVVAVVASPLMLELAKSVGAWLIKHPAATVTITIGEGAEKVEVSASGLTNAEAFQAVQEALTKS